MRHVGRLGGSKRSLPLHLGLHAIRLSDVPGMFRFPCVPVVFKCVTIFKESITRGIINIEHVSEKMVKPWICCFRSLA